MIELPEALALAKQLRQETKGKTIAEVRKPSYAHKFAWFHGDVDTYPALLTGRRVEDIQGLGIFVEICLDDDLRLNFNDGVNLRYLRPGEQAPEKYQLYIAFTDGSALAFTVAMYGGFACYDRLFDSPYYLKSRDSISPLSDAFDKAYFDSLYASVKPTISAKAFLATEQRIPGLGNGVLQDILLQCRIHPRRKIETLSDVEKQSMFRAVKEVLSEITEAGGRDTEKDIYGNPGGYKTKLSKNTWKSPCPYCGGILEKKAFMGGSVYYCTDCQPL